MPGPGDVEQTDIINDDENLDNDNLRYYFGPGMDEEYDLYMMDAEYYLDPRADGYYYRDPRMDEYNNPWLYEDSPSPPRMRSPSPPRMRSPSPPRMRSPPRIQPFRPPGSPPREPRLPRIQPSRPPGSLPRTGGDAFPNAAPLDGNALAEFLSGVMR